LVYFEKIGLLFDFYGHFLLGNDILNIYYLGKKTVLMGFVLIFMGKIGIYEKISITW
jgi:hypothetical protein